MSDFLTRVRGILSGRPDGLSFAMMGRNRAAVLEQLPADGIERVEVITNRVWSTVAVKVSANAYRSEIDASNLGFSGRRQATAWDAKFNATWDASKQTLVQVNANYMARRLTPQGYRHPTTVLNVGLKHTFAGTQTAFVLTVSDVFASLKERTSIETPVLREEIVRRRATRVVFAGFTHAFGQPAKKVKDDLPYESSEAGRRP